jgi:glucosyl-3-phosphoglycerate phosphatase
MEAGSVTNRWAAEEPAESAWREARLVLIRHGESIWNAERRVQGQAGTGLSELGRRQAEQAAGHLMTTYPEPTAVIGSDLERVVQTAEPYLARSGRELELDKRLREIDTGAWSGLLMTEVTERFPEQIAAVQRGEDIARGGGENFAAMRARVGEALRSIAGAVIGHAPLHGSATALVFTHGGPIRVGTADLLGLPPDGHRQLEPPENCSITVLHLVADESGAFSAARLIGYNSPPAIPS